MKHSNTSPTVAQVETIYRAKKKYLDKEYIEGHLVKDSLFDRYYIINWFRVENDKEQNNGYIEIDPSTRAIHFTNSGMNDSEGTPIFASLSENGNGGSSLDRFDNGTYYDSILVKIRDINHLDWDASNYNMPDLTTKVTGIHTVKEES